MSKENSESASDQECENIRVLPEREIWVDLLRVVTIFFILVFHMRSAAPDKLLWNYVVTPGLIFFLFFMGYFTRWNDSESILWRWKWVTLSYMLWGTISLFVNLPAIIFIAENEAILNVGHLRIWAKRGLTAWCTGGVNWAFWFLGAMFAFYSALGGIILIRKGGHLRLAGISCIVFIVMLVGIPVIGCPFIGAFYIPLIGMLIRPYCDIKTLTYWVGMLSFPCLLIFVVLYTYTYIVKDYPVEQFPFWQLSGFLGLCGLGIMVAHNFPRVAKSVARLAPAMFFVFISHMLFLYNPVFALLGLPIPVCCLVATMYILVVYAFLRLLNNRLPRFLLLINCGCAVR